MHDELVDKVRNTVYWAWHGPGTLGWQLYLRGSGGEDKIEIPMGGARSTCSAVGQSSSLVTRPSSTSHTQLDLCRPLQDVSSGAERL